MTQLRQITTMELVFIDYEINKVFLIYKCIQLVSAIAI